MHYRSMVLLEALTVREQADGWTGGNTVRTPRYGLEELTLHQQLLTCAKPQVLLEWEFCAGFPVQVSDKEGHLQPTFGYGFLAQVLHPHPASRDGLGRRERQ